MYVFDPAKYSDVAKGRIGAEEGREGNEAGDRNQSQSDAPLVHEQQLSAAS
jgi:hypothetical protein